MDEQRKCEREAVNGVHRDAACADKSLWEKVMPPLLYLAGRALFSKGLTMSGWQPVPGGLGSRCLTDTRSEALGGSPAWA